KFQLVEQGLRLSRSRRREHGKKSERKARARRHDLGNARQRPVLSRFFWLTNLKRAWLTLSCPQALPRLAARPHARKLPGEGSSAWPTRKAERPRAAKPHQASSIPPCARWRPKPQVSPPSLRRLPTASA